MNPHRSRARLPGLLAVLAVAAVVAALVLVFDNPTVDVAATDAGGEGPAGTVGCSIAPWDAGLNGTAQGPGGEHSQAYVDEVGAECHDAGTTRFASAVGLGVLGGVLAGSAVAGALRRRSQPG